MGLAMHRSAWASAPVGCMLITTRWSPRKYRMSPAAGYTTRLVPPMMRVSAWRMAFTAPDSTSSSKPSSYSTTSGLTMPPHFSQRGTPVLLAM